MIGSHEITYKVVAVDTEPYNDQKPGTSGLRKKTDVFVNSKHYTENFIQSTLSALRKFQANKANGDKITSIVVGGDGREYGKEAIQVIVKICLANKVSHLLIARDGIMSTPTASHLIRSKNADGGFLLTASHNPGGLQGDFGVKFNDNNGAPAPEELTDLIYEHSTKIRSFESIVDLKPVDISADAPTTRLKASDGNEEFEMKVEIVDSVQEYCELAEKLFEFPLIVDLFKPSVNSKFRCLADSLHGVMGPYISAILCKRFGMATSDHLHAAVLPDFGGLHPDPNLTYARKLVETMQTNSQFKFGIAFDGDGDRNMVIGQEGFFVTPSDALAVIAANSRCIRAFWSTGDEFQDDKTKSTIKGLARSMPTAPAVDRFAKKNNLACYETPTGWKYFCNLFQDNRISICGEESFGLGADHIREKDGMWACLAWLSIMAVTKKTVEELVHDYWQEYGRDYSCRFDYESVESNLAGKFIEKIEALIESQELVGKSFGSYKHKVAVTDNWCYTDQVTFRETPKQGYRIVFENGARVVIRLSGTGSSGATIRLYFNDYSETDINKQPTVFMEELIVSALEIIDIRSLIKRKEPSVIT